MRILSNSEVKSVLKRLGNIRKALSNSVTDANIAEVLYAIDDVAKITAIVGGLDGLIAAEKEIRAEGDKLKTNLIASELNAALHREGENG